MQKSPSMLALAANVRRLMTERGWSQQALERESGVSKSAIGYLLAYADSSDRHSGVDSIEAIAKAFGVAPHELLILGATTNAARNLHGVGEQGQTYGRRHEGTSIDVDGLALILEQIAAASKGTYAQRAALAAEIYNATAGSGKRPTRSAVLRLIRSA